MQFIFGRQGTIGVFETIGLMFVTTHYGWDGVRSGLTISIFGAVGVAFLLCFSYLLQVFSDVDLVLYGMVTMLFSCLLLLADYAKGSAAVPLWQFYVSIVMMYSVGYPIGHTALLGVFSKIHKAGPQGLLLGFFGSAGSLARVFFPVLAGVLCKQYSDKAIFSVMAGLLALSCFLYTIYRQTIRTVISLP